MVFTFFISANSSGANPFLWPALPEMVYDHKLTAAHAQPEPFIAERLGYCAHAYCPYSHPFLNSIMLIYV
jgi:hypothetical protein